MSGLNDHHFDFRLNSAGIVHMVMLLSAAVTSASSKTNAATLNLLPKVIYALRFNGHPVFRIFTKKSSTPPSLPYNGLDYFENLNVIPSRFDGCRNTPKEQLRYSRKTKGRVQLFTPAVRLIIHPPSTLSYLVDCYNTTISQRLNKHAPLKSKIVHTKPRNCWYTQALNKLKFAKHLLERRHSSEDRKNLRSATNHYQTAIIKAKRIYKSSLISSI